MGTFGKSFKKELGKNTGRYVSNKVFGDSHASKHKVTIQRESERAERKAEREVARAERNYEKEQRQIEKENRREEREAEREAKRLEIEERKKLRHEIKEQKEAEKEYKRWLKEQERIEQEEEKEANINEAKSFQNYIDAIQEIHKVPVDSIDWNDLIISKSNNEQTIPFVDYYFASLEINDELFEESAELIISHQNPHASLLSRKLKIGFNRAKRLMEILENHYIISQSESSGSRNILVNDISLINKRVSNAELIKKKDEKLEKVLTGNLNLYDDGITVPKERPKDYDNEYLNLFLSKNNYWSIKEEYDELSIKAEKHLEKCDNSILGKDFTETKNNLIERIESYDWDLYKHKERREEIKTEFNKFKKNPVNKLLSNKKIKLYEETLDDYDGYVKNDSSKLAKHNEALEPVSECAKVELELQNIENELSKIKDYIAIWDEAWKKAYNKKESDDYINLIARKVLEKNESAYPNALDLFPIWEFTADFGSSVEADFYSDITEVDFFVNIENVVPENKKTATQAGKLTIKPFSNIERNLIIQDYVCSSILRIAKEAFSVLPINEILVNAIDKVLNTSTGNYEDAFIVSVKIDRLRFSELSLNLIDPSDAVEGFECSMLFSKSNGFKPTRKINIKPKKTKKSKQTLSKKPTSELKNSDGELESANSDKKNIQISASMTVGELRLQFKELFGKEVNVLTTKGNPAGEKRKLRALTKMEIKGLIEFELIKLTKKSLKEIYKNVGLKIDY